MPLSASRITGARHLTEDTTTSTLEFDVHIRRGCSHDQPKAPPAAHLSQNGCRGSPLQSTVDPGIICNKLSCFNCTHTFGLVIFTVLQSLTKRATITLSIAQPIRGAIVFRNFIR